MSGGASIGVVLAGGGTGGHIQPNLAVAEAMASMAPAACRFRFVVSNRPIDQRVLEGESVEGRPVAHHVSPARPLAMKPIGLARFAMNWAGGVRAGRAAVRSLAGECDRVVMLATGGFVSAPAVMGACAERVERIVVNLDAVPGKANRLASRFATETLSVGRDLPPIVRESRRAAVSVGEARRGFELDADTPTLLVTGGSQGARSVNQFVARWFEEYPKHRGWQVIHQTGDGDQEECAAGWANLGIRAFVAPYIGAMGRAFAAADAVVCRGGAGTVADLWASGRPSLILPYPYHRDGHQALNAGPLCDAGGAMVAEDHVDPGRNLTAHSEKIDRLLDDASREEMRLALTKLGPADGADRLARRLLGPLI